MNPFLDPLLTNIMQYPQSTSGSPASSVPRFSSPLRTSTSEQAASVEQQLQQQQQQQQSGFPTYNPLGTTQRIEASGQLGSGRPSPRLITAGLSSGSHSSRPRSAVNRHPSPAALQPYRRRYNSISSLPPIQSASFNTMPAEWNEPCLLFAQDSSTYDYSHRNEDRQALGLSNGSAQMPPTSSLGLSQDFFGDQSQYNNMFETSNPMQSQPSQPQQSRPYLALDIQQTFGLLQSQQPPSAQSSNLPSSVPTDPASISDGERIITPGMFSGYPNVQQTMNNFQSYGDATQPTWDLHQQSSFSSYQQQFQPSTEQYQQNAFQQQQQMQYFQQMTQSQPQQQQYQYDQNLISAQLAQQLQQVLVPHPHQGTISPSQLSQDTLKPISSSGRLFDIPCSSSSASSTDGGDWQNPSLNPRDTWSRSMQSAIPHRPASQNELSRQSSLARSSPVGNSTVSDTSHTMSMGNEYVQSESSQSIPSTRPTYHPDPSDLEGNLRQYLSTSNRLSFGERKIIVMSPKVGQKSYGNEKRFLCPPPQAVLIGAAWWTESPDGCPISPMLPPKVNVSIAGEQSVKDAAVNWLSIHGDSLDEKLNVQAIKASDLPFVGHVAGKNLHITDADGKRREVKALVTVKAPDLQHAGKNGWGHGKGTVDDVSVNEVVGTFESKEIKIISKPSKKKSNTKSNDLLITHGSTVALFNRIKSQTLSTRFLAADLDSTKILGSDGLPVSGARPPRRGDGSNDLAGFVPHQNTWESWIVWLVDPSRPEGPGRNAPLHPDWPVAPANALHTPHHAPPIRYNQTVVLQSLQTGICSPIMIVRRIESDSDAVGGDGTAGDSQTSVREGEWAGDYVSQLQKVAFERYRPDTMFVVQTDPRWGGSWLACDQDVIFERKVTNTRKWSPVPPAPTRASSKPSSVPSTPSSRFGVLPMTPHTNSVNLPSTPSSPVSASSSMDYFGAHSRKQSSSSLVMSPNSSGHIELPMSTDGGPVRRQRTGSNSRNGPLARPTNHKRRQSTEINSANSSYEHVQSAANSHNQQTVSPGDKAHQGRMFWTMSVGDMAVWTIVSTEQVSYTFYIPHSVATLPSDRKAPIAPFPTISRMLGPKQMTEMPATVQRLHSSGDLTFTPRTELPLVTVYGKGFVKTEGFHAPHLIYWGDQKAVHNEVRCTEVMAASEPVGVEKPTPVFLVREDGLCIIPTGMQYP